jgi:hypothetical protein
MIRDISSDGYPAFWSGGLRGTPWEHDPWSIGVSLEVALYSGMEETVRWNYDTYQELHFDPTVEINAGLSVGYSFGSSILYAGPLLHLGYMSADARTHVFGPDWSVQDSVNSVTIRDKPGWGCFIGWQRAFADGDWNIQLEGSVLSGGFGGAISCFKSW